MPEWPASVPADRQAEGPGLGRERARSFGWFLLAVVYALLAEQVAPRFASLFAPGVFFPFVSSLLFLLVLLVGFSAMAMLGQRQSRPLAQMGLVRRPGAMREWSLGTALGWAGIIACVLPVALIGGLAVNLNNQSFLYGVTTLCVDFLTLLTASLAAEVLFRGYPFQRLMDTTGVTLASLLVSLLFAIDRMGSEQLSLTNFLVTFLLGLLLCMAYLRTRALWVGWGFHFAWSASTAILFGLPVSGRTEFSPIISNYTAGPEWLTGGGVGTGGFVDSAPRAAGVGLCLSRALLATCATAGRSRRSSAQGFPLILMDWRRSSMLRGWGLARLQSPPRRPWSRSRQRPAQRPGTSLPSPEKCSAR